MPTSNSMLLQFAGIMTTEGVVVYGLGRLPLPERTTMLAIAGNSFEVEQAYHAGIAGGFVDAKKWPLERFVERVATVAAGDAAESSATLVLPDESSTLPRLSDSAMRSYGIGSPAVLSAIVPLTEEDVHAIGGDTGDHADLEPDGEDAHGA